MNLRMLLALVTMQHTLSKLDTLCMQETRTGSIFTIGDTLKTTRPGKHPAPIEILSFTPDPVFTWTRLDVPQDLRNLTYVINMVAHVKFLLMTNPKYEKIGLH